MSEAILSKEQTITIDSLSAKGRGISSEKKIEVAGALPGEEVLIELGGRQKKIRKGYLRQVITPSADRVEPRCPHVPDCGGCSLQHMDYDIQLDLKARKIQEEFASLIQEHNPEIRPIQGCENPWRYRNKMEFSFSENRVGEKFLGLMLAGARGKVLNLSECLLVSKWYMDGLNAVRQWWLESGYSAYHHRSDQGHLRTLTMRESKQGQGKMVMLTVSGNPDFALKKSQIDAFIETIQKYAPDPHLSIFLQVHQIAKGRATQFYEMLLHGPDHITEKLYVELAGKQHALDFKISPTSFFQPNTLQAQWLYSEGLQMLTALSDARVFDLYCGGATLGLCAAKEAKEVVGIELNPHSVFDAGWNQEVNKIDNFSIERGDVGSVLAKWKEESKWIAPDVVIVDPPRAGLDEKALCHIQALGAGEILYISCNPKTQRENIELLCQAGYQLKIIQPVDQFPHTMHIENICMLSKN